MISRFIPEALAISPAWVTLDSGLKVCIDSKLSLECFVELFLTQPYTPAFDILTSYNVIVDVGANRGMFLLSALNYLRKQGLKTPQFYCVEAAKPNFLGLKRHIDANSLTDSVVMAQGAVCGKRNGFVNFYYSPRAHGMGTIINRKRLISRKVPVIDLATFIDAPRIDLLKLDIEGAEEGFLAEYPEVLAKTQVLVGEFHLKEVDYPLCRKYLEERGLFFYRRTFQHEEKLCVDIYARKKTRE